MRIPSLFCLCVLLAACGGGASASPDGGPTAPHDGGALPGADASSVQPGPDASAAGDPLVEAWLKEHNDVRAGAKPTPSPALPALTWNASAASVAAAWAANCTWKHNSGRGNYGENIAAATYALTPAQVVSDWASESADYDYAANDCSDVCGHYTQLVWRDTTSVGCAVQKCTTGSPFSISKTWYFAVCDYSPPGNMNGERPY